MPSLPGSRPPWPSIRCSREGADAVLPKLESCRVGDGVSLSMETYMDRPHSRQNHHVVRYEEINKNYFRDAGRMTTPKLARDERIRTFNEIDLPVPVDTAIREAKRASIAVSATSATIVIFSVQTFLSSVTGRAVRGISMMITARGCGICSHECPRGVITMEDLIL